MLECGEGVDALVEGVGVEGVDDALVEEGGFEVLEVGGTEVADELVLGFEALVSLVEHADGGGDDVVEADLLEVAGEGGAFDLLPVIGHGGSPPGVGGWVQMAASRLRL